MHRQRRREIRPAILSQKRPVIVCLCGSVRFLEGFDAACLAETLAGRIVLSIGSHRQRDEDALGYLEGFRKTAAPDRLAELHRRKIDLADEIVVVIVGSSVGNATRSEIEYVRQVGEQVRWLEPLAS